MEDPIAERINAGGDLLVKIITSGVIKTIAAAIGGVFVYALFENRVEAVRVIFTSTPIMISLGVGILLGAIGYLFNLSIAKTELANQKNEAFKNERILELKAEVLELKQGRRATDLIIEDLDPRPCPYDLKFSPKHEDEK